MSVPRLIGSGGPIQLGKQLARGGEGAVYEVVGNAARVAKVYLKDISPERSEKLVSMQALRTAALDSLTAWPTELLRLPNGKVGGFLMANLHNSKDIHALYSPRSRLAEFPNADWRMLVRACLNTARAFAVLHEAGCLVGDVNHGGVRVAQDATVRLIDCDSFQVTVSGKTFVCEVGVDNFTPAELQGKSFKATVRSKNHDNFGLAVLVFQMLMMGRHPFAGRYRGAEDMPVDKAISQFRYAYSNDTGATGMQVPPHSAPVLAASSEVAELWERAFGRNGVLLNGRPTAHEWVRTLSKLESSFARCGKNPVHYYFAPYGKCPWCPIEQVGVALFPIPSGFVISPAGGTFRLEVVWAQIKGVAPPAHVPTTFAIPHGTPSPKAFEAKASRGNWKIGGFFAGLVTLVFGVMLNENWWIPWLIAAWFTGKWVSGQAKGDGVKPFEDQFNLTKRNYDFLAQRWSSEAVSSAFSERLHSLEKLREELLALPTLREQRYAKLVASRKTDAMRLFLDKFEIDRAKISGIGNAKKAMLESYGIETAADVVMNAVLQVPGFGPALTSKLLAWRSEIERKFQFDPKSGVDPRHVADLDRTIALRRIELQEELQKGPSSLLQLRSSILAKRTAIQEPLSRAIQEVAQATADLNYVR